MRPHLLAWPFVALVLAAPAAWLAPAAEEKAGASALQANPAGWLNLLPGKDLAGWKRVPLAPDTRLNARNPWSVDLATQTLRCDGVGIKEMFLHEKPFANGIFHVEWRFQPVADNPPYNSGVYVRSRDDGKVWVQAQIVHQKEPPLLGDLFADLPVDGEVKRTLIRGDGASRARPPGEWNTYEITCKGKDISVWVNGAVATRWSDCPLPNGHVGVQAEFYQIEFRNLKFKPLP